MNQSYIGCSYYITDYQYAPHTLLLAVACSVNGISTYALLDTASHWCMLPLSVSERLGYSAVPDGITPPMHTRFGVLEGRLERIPMALTPDEGVAVHLEATCFLSEDWTGPMVLGWKGCLERIRFALDPTQEAFYFSEQ